MLRFYGTAAIAVRSAAFTQGFVVLSATGYLASSGSLGWALFTAVFCFLFTCILSYSHLHYCRYFFDVRQHIFRLEVASGFSGDLSYVTSVEKPRDDRVEGHFLGFLRIHGGFILIGFAALSAILAILVLLTIGG